ncbi:MAG: hypothetical protein KDD82_19410 [Planctomycetes bacterium]|nr:hypothetical protein [Planctomycetota bacterium]
MSFSTSGRFQVEAAHCLQRLVYALVALAMIGFACAFLSGCASTGRALEHAEANAAYSAAHADDTSLPSQARAIGEVNRISWQVQVYLLGGEKPDPDVIALLPEDFRREIGLLPEAEAQ